MKKTDQAPNLTILLGMWKFFKSPCLYWAVLFKDEEFEAHCIIVVSVSLASNMSQFSWRMFTCLNSSGRRVKQYIRTIFYIRLWYSTILFKNNTWNKSDLPMTLQRMKSFNYKEKNQKGLLLVFFSTREQSHYTAFEVEKNDKHMQKSAQKLSTWNKL